MIEPSSDHEPTIPSPNEPSTAAVQTFFETPARRNPLEQLTLPARFGDFDLIERIGKGGMGVVFKAMQRALRRICALKLIRPDHMTSEIAKQRFERELIAGARLTHPHIALVHHAGECDGVYYLSLEYIPGSDLDSLVRRFGPLDPETAASMIRQAALGLQHAHERGLIHRDIKPSNLMVTTFEKPVPTTVVKVLDFGVARLGQTDDGQPLSNLTHDGAILGTPDFMAPEQADDPRAADIRSDLYSLGCTLYYLLTGRPPFPEGTMYQKLKRHHEETAPPLEHFRRDVPHELSAIMKKLMAKRPADRIPTPLELVELLARLNWQPESFVGKAPPVTLPSTTPATTVHTIVDRLARRELQGLTETATAVCFHPEGDSVFAASADGIIREWSLAEDVTSYRRAHLGRITGLACSPRGDYLYSIGKDGTFRIWSLSPEKNDLCLLQEPVGLSCLATATQADAVLIGDRAGRVHWWAAAGSRPILFDDVHEVRVTAVALTPDGKQAASADGLGNIFLWDVVQRKPRHLLQTRGWFRQGASLRGLQFRDDGSLLYSIGWDGMLRVWDVRSGRALQIVQQPSVGLHALVLTPDQETVILASGGEPVEDRMQFDNGTRQEIRLLRTQGLTEPASTLLGHWGATTCLAVHPGGILLASGGTDQLVIVQPLAGAAPPR